MDYVPEPQRPSLQMQSTDRIHIILPIVQSSSNLNSRCM